jgi:DNA-binding NarL/FixJ family response regulator
MKKHILLVDDHDVVRDGVKKILDAQSDGFVFGEAGTVADALKLVHARQWDCAVVDLSIGARSGLELIKGIRQIQPRLPVVVFTMHGEEQYARRAFKAGAAGYLTKESPREELVRAIHKVMEGGRYVSPTLAERLVVDISQGGDASSHESLSDREFEVLRLIGSGKTVGEIASLLFLSDKTISTYRSRILEKMDLRNNAEITRYVVENHLSE